MRTPRVKHWCIVNRSQRRVSIPLACALSAGRMYVCAADICSLLYLRRAARLCYEIYALMLSCVCVHCPLCSVCVTQHKHNTHTHVHKICERDPHPSSTTATDRCCRASQQHVIRYFFRSVPGPDRARSECVFRVFCLLLSACKKKTRLNERECI